MDELVLADIQALAASPDYGGRGFIQPSSAVLGLSAALFLDDLSLWRGAGYELTDGEKDDIQAMIAQLEEDLMVTDEMYPMDRVKVQMSAPQSIPTAAVTTLRWDVEIYDPQNMHSTPISRIVAQRDGLHIIAANIIWGIQAVGIRALTLRANRASGGGDFDIAMVSTTNPLGTWYVGQSTEVQFYAEAGDYFYATVYQTSGSPVNILQHATNENPFFAAVRL